MFYFGVDYYPEQWPEEYWPEAALLMAEAGFNVVRLADFAWSKLEPRDGRFEFDWLDRAIDSLATHAIQVVLATPTASPPPWLMHKLPQAFRVGQDGHRLTYGNRREYCPNNPDYLDSCRCIVRQMATRYCHHPSVIGWQIDNEFGDRCYCPVCARAFHQWLHQRYGCLEKLNQTWGTEFWSHIYADWEEIPLPLQSGGSPNPGLALDFYRFSSDSYRAFQQVQVEIIRQNCPSHFVTHNLMGFDYDQIDYFDLARELDFVSLDNYPRTQWNMQADVEPSRLALAHCTMRGLKHRNYWVIEQQAGAGGWEMMGVPPKPGELRLWAYQSIAHGADGILFFRWRTARRGAEQYWHGLLDTHGRPGRRYAEIRRMGAEIEKIAESIFGSAVKPAVAMLLSYPARFAFHIQPNNPQFDYSEHFHDLFQAFFHRHTGIDILYPGADLSGYKIVVAPALHILPEEVARDLRQFVEAGGVLVVTSRSGVKDESGAMVEQPLPGLLSGVCGVEIEECVSLPSGVYQTLEFSAFDLQVCDPPFARIWCDVLEPRGAQVVARYTSDYFAGKPAITLNNLGRGLAVYVGTVGDSYLYDTLARWLLGLAGVQPPIIAPPRVEVAERWQGDQRILFVLNHTLS
ncbi:MAG TPA: beta-galactosidase, partial [Anaerolineales bacterium]|nr:beta-galactosidase [Anaerolineales bacterium]